MVKERLGSGELATVDLQLERRTYPVKLRLNEGAWQEERNTLCVVAVTNYPQTRRSALRGVGPGMTPFRVFRSTVLLGN
jgi:hypothetical protein